MTISCLENVRFKELWLQLQLIQKSSKWKHDGSRNKPATGSRCRSEEEEEGGEDQLLLAGVPAVLFFSLQRVSVTDGTNEPNRDAPESKCGRASHAPFVPPANSSFQPRHSRFPSPAPFPSSKWRFKVWPGVLTSPAAPPCAQSCQCGGAARWRRGQDFTHVGWLKKKKSH